MNDLSNATYGITMTIVTDDDPLDPRKDFDHLGKMFCFHKRRNLGDKHSIDFNDFTGWDEMEKHIRSDLDGAVVLPLYLFDHSGLNMSTSPFGCLWDSGQVGFIYATRSDILKEWKVSRLSKKVLAKAAAVLESEVQVYTQYLSGDVYGYVVRLASGEILDSCWGFYGEADCISEGTQAFHHCVARAARERLDSYSTNQDFLSCRI
jgi:hypothetical protein